MDPSDEQAPKGAMNEADARAMAQGAEEPGMPPQQDPSPLADEDQTPEWAKNGDDPGEGEQA